CLRHGAPPLHFVCAAKNCCLYRISIMRYRERRPTCFTRCNRGRRMVKKVALEEHFLCPDFIEYWNPTVIDLPAVRRNNALARLTDFDEVRLAAMDEAGIPARCLGSPVLACRRSTTPQPRFAARVLPTTFSRGKLRAGPIAIPDLPISPCRIRT